MDIYVEKKVGKLSTFIKQIIDDNTGEIVLEREVNVPLYKIDKDNFTYFVLYNDDMVPYSSVFEYLNYDLKESPITTRARAAYALRMLYCFLSLSNYKENEITETVFKQLVFFLRGLNPHQNAEGMKTTRCVDTVNGYLSTYRSYFAKRGFYCKPLFDSHMVTETVAVGDYTSSNQRKKYDNNLAKSTVNENTVPKYISPDDFAKLFLLARKTDNKTAEIIMRLMYGLGLRLGEVLGLTMEDIQEVRDNGRLIPCLYLRNRISDKPFQYAKNLPHVLEKRFYATSDYQRAKHKIIVTYDLYEDLIEYIENTHEEAMEKYPANYEKGRADIVSVRNKPDDNHYVFLNKQGKVLSGQTWDNWLKALFKEADIPLDEDIRENNLSHRFRHGFAMFHARFSEHPVDVLTLQKMMRHKAISSTMVYFNPTPTDELEIKTGFQKELYELLPELSLKELIK